MSTKEYIVQYGDSWFRIANKLYGSQMAAAALHKSAHELNPTFNELRPGDTIRVEENLAEFALITPPSWGSPLDLVLYLWEKAGKAWHWWRGEL